MSRAAAARRPRYRERVTAPDRPSQAPLSREQTLRIARLARLELSDEQADRLASQLSGILDHVRELRSLELDDVAPMLHPHDQFGEPAPDEPAPGLAVDVVRRLAPRSEGPFIRVPKVLGDGGGGA